MDSSMGSHGTLRVHLERGEEACAIVSDWGQVCPIECSGAAALGESHESHPSFNVTAQVWGPEAGVCSAAQAGCLTLGEMAIPVTMSPADLPTTPLRPTPHQSPQPLPLPANHPLCHSPGAARASSVKGLNFNSGSPGFSSAGWPGQTAPALGLSFSKNLS